MGLDWLTATATATAWATAVVAAFGVHSEPRDYTGSSPCMSSFFFSTYIPSLGLSPKRLHDFTKAISSLSAFKRRWHNPGRGGGRKQRVVAVSARPTRAPFTPPYFWKSTRPNTALLISTVISSDQPPERVPR